MFYTVCTRYCGQPTLLAEFDTEKEAVEFMNNPYILFSADETDTDEDEIIYPNEMYIETNEISFYEELYKNREARDKEDAADSHTGVSEDEIPF